MKYIINGKEIDGKDLDAEIERFQLGRESRREKESKKRGWENWQKWLIWIAIIILIRFIIMMFNPAIYNPMGGG